KYANPDAIPANVYSRIFALSIIPGNIDQAASIALELAAAYNSFHPANDYQIDRSLRDARQPREDPTEGTLERHFRLGRYLLASSLARRRCGLVLCPAPAQRTGPEVDVSFVAGILAQLVIVIAGQGHRDLPR